MLGITGLRKGSSEFFGIMVLGSLLVLVVPLGLAQQQPQEQPESVQEPEVYRPSGLQSAPVVLDGRVLFTVLGIPSYPAARRAELAVKAIQELAEDSSFSPGQLTLVEEEESTRIKFGDKSIVSVHALDAAEQGVGRTVLAGIFRQNIENGVLAYRVARTPRVLLTHAAYAILSVLALLGLLYLIWRFSYRRQVWLERRYKSKFQDVRIQSLELVRKERLWEAVRGILRGIRILLTLILVLACIRYILGLFPWTRSLADEGINLLLIPLTSIFEGILSALPGLVFIAVLALFVWSILKILRLFFAGVEEGSLKLAGFQPEWSWPTYKVIRMGLIAFGLVVAYPYIPGADTNAFKGITIFFGVLFSIGSTSFTSNVIAGYNLIYRRAFQVGDRVQIGDTIGDVVQIRHQVTHIRSLKNEEVILPNSSILNSPVVNYSSLARRGGLILHTTVGIGYETPWRQVESMLLMAAARTDRLLKKPAPFVLQLSLGDFCVVYELNVHTNQPNAAPKVYTDLHRNIQDVFNEYEVQIMTPAYRADPPEPKLVPRDKWFEAPAAPDDETE